MTGQASPYAPVMAVAAGVGFAVGVLLWRHREGPGGVYVSLLLFALTVRAGAYAAGYARADLAGKLLAVRVAYVGIGLTPVSGSRSPSVTPVGRGCRAGDSSPSPPHSPSPRPRRGCRRPCR